MPNYGGDFLDGYMRDKYVESNFGDQGAEEQRLFDGMKMLGVGGVAAAAETDRLMGSGDPAMMAEVPKSERLRILEERFPGSTRRINGIREQLDLQPLPIPVVLPKV